MDMSIVKSINMSRDHDSFLKRLMSRCVEPAFKWTLYYSRSINAKTFETFGNEDVVHPPNVSPVKQRVNNKRVKRE